MATIAELEKKKQAIESEIAVKKLALNKVKKEDKELVHTELDATNAQLRDAVLRLDSSITDVINQMRANIERAEREGMTDAPPLDRNNPENKGRTQYDIDKAILAEYQAKKGSLASEHPEVFRVEVTEL